VLRGGSVELSGLLAEPETPPRALVLALHGGGMTAGRDMLRSRVAGAFQAVNYGTRPGGAQLGSAFGLRPALRAAALGGVAGSLNLLLPTPLPRYRLP
jgi:hypothetical protein